MPVPIITREIEKYVHGKRCKRSGKPMYANNVTTEEYENLKRENAELKAQIKALTHNRKGNWHDG